MKWFFAWLAVIVALVILVFGLRSIARSASGDTGDSMQTIIHARNNPGVHGVRAPQSCPPGYRLVKDLFEEKDGSKQDAYVAKKPPASGNFSIDYLMPGEQVSVAFGIRGDPSPEKTGDAM